MYEGMWLPSPMSGSRGGTLRVLGESSEMIVSLSLGLEMGRGESKLSRLGSRCSGVVDGVGKGGWSFCMGVCGWLDRLIWGVVVVGALRLMPD